MPKIYDEERSRKYKQVAQHVGARIREARTMREMQQKDLCALLARSTSWLSFIEQGVNAPNIMDLMLLSEALELPMDYFLTDNEFVSSFRAPENEADWRMMFPGQPDRAMAHEGIDRIYRNAERVFRAKMKAGVAG